MNNSIENGLIAAILLLIIFIPVYIAVRNSRSKKKRRITHELHLLEQQHNLSFQVIEQFDSFAIAADKVKKTLIKVDLKDYSSELIDLGNVADCTVEEKKQRNVIQLLQLVLWDKNKQPMHYIVFYRQYIDNEGNLKKTVRIAAQWEEMIRAIVNNRLLTIEKSI